MDEVITSSKLLRTTSESESATPSKFKKIKAFLKRIKAYFVYTPKHTDPIPDKKDFQSYAAFQKALNDWVEKHLGSPKTKLEAKKR